MSPQNSFNAQILQVFEAEHHHSKTSSLRWCFDDGGLRSGDSGVSFLTSKKIAERSTPGLYT